MFGYVCLELTCPATTSGVIQSTYLPGHLQVHLPTQNHLDRQPRGFDLDIFMNDILPSRCTFLWLLAVILAGYHVLTRFFELATSFFIVSSLSVIQAANMDISVDLSWHAPISSRINSLSSAINGTGTYGFVFNSSTLPEGIPYGIVIFPLFSNFGSSHLLGNVQLVQYAACPARRISKGELFVFSRIRRGNSPTP